MPERALDVVRRKLVHLVRADPTFRPVATLDRWIAARFSPDEVQVLFRFEREYGEAALAEWFTEALLEAGAIRVPVRDAA